MELNLIVAVDEKWGIGKNNKLLFSIPDDMKFFRRMTLNTVVVSGKNNLLSFPGGKPLPKRRNIILSSTLSASEEYEVVRSIDELMELIKDIDDKDIFVIGGAEVYRELLPYCKKAYVTKMYKDFGGDRFFPDLDENSEWELKSEGEMLNYEGLEYRFNVYENIKISMAK